jgi:hypothetical protein
LIIAKAIKCVNETFPPRARLRWLLITIRLSIINFAGTARTLVAVGTVSEPSMLVTTRALTPRIGSNLAASGVLKTGAGLTIGSAGVGVCSERSRTSFCVADVVGAVGVAGIAAAGATGATGATGAGVATGAAAAAFGVGGIPPRGASAIGALVAAEELCEEELFGLYVLKNSIHAGSREEGSAK